MLLSADLSVAGNQGLEVQLFHPLERVDPVVGVVAAHRAVGDRLHGNEIDGEEQLVRGKQDDQTVIRVVPPGIDQFDVVRPNRWPSDR